MRFKIYGTFTPMSLLPKVGAGTPSSHQERGPIVAAWLSTKHWAFHLIADLLLAVASLALLFPALLINSKPLSM